MVEDRGRPRLDSDMQDTPSAYYTTRELADLLRIKERKVYDMAAAGQVPCVRVVGKLLFPVDDIANWIDASRSGPQTGPSNTQLPDVVAGSHDPLLDWALHASASGLATFFDGSLDGLSRLEARQALACGTHIHENGDWNTKTVSERLGSAPVVLVEFARRQRGLIVPPDNPEAIKTIPDLTGLRVARRQATAASQGLFDSLARQDGIADHLPEWDLPTARTEEDLAMLVFSRKADAAFGLACVATQYRLDFVPVLEERFDLLVWRHAWFEPQFQRFLSFAQSPEFRAKAAELGGYNLGGFGQVHFNGSTA